MLPTEPSNPFEPEDEIVHATINADPVAATSGDGSEPQPVEDPYDVENPDEVEPDPGPEPEYTPDWNAMDDVQDTGDDIEPDAPDTDEDGQ